MKTKYIIDLALYSLKTGQKKPTKFISIQFAIRCHSSSKFWYPIVIFVVKRTKTQCYSEPKQQEYHLGSSTNKDVILLSLTNFTVLVSLIAAYFSFFFFHEKIYLGTPPGLFVKRGIIFYQRSESFWEGNVTSIRDGRDLIGWNREITQWTRTTYFQLQITAKSIITNENSNFPRSYKSCIRIMWKKNSWVVY